MGDKKLSTTRMDPLERERERERERTHSGTCHCKYSQGKKKSSLSSYGRHANVFLHCQNIY